MKIEPAGDMREAYPQNILSFNYNPNQTGWNKAVANCEIITDRDTAPLLNLILPYNSKYCVGAAKKENGKYKFIYMPAYAFLPFMFSRQNEMMDWSEASADSFGTALINKCVNILLKDKK